MRAFNRVKGKLLRKAINIADRIDIWFRNNFNVNMKQKALELSQDNVSMKKLDKTIGVHLGTVHKLKD
jgi:hypothetical protein|tara:strand:+ start:890 stop:1093 length:204 start_codon:yes stop_codon:yes gene_type:complete